MKNDQTVQCDVLTHCAHLCMLYEWVFCSHLPSVFGKFHLPETETGPKTQQKFTNCQTAKNAKNSNFSSSNCYGPTLLTRANATGFPATLNFRTASWFEDRLDSRARRLLRMLVLFVVVIVDQNWSTLLLSIFRMFVVDSFAFSFCLSKIRS